jgi:hypothetical protein
MRLCTVVLYSLRVVSKPEVMSTVQKPQVLVQIRQPFPAACFH